jgi:hypothetical protein
MILFAKDLRNSALIRVQIKISNARNYCQRAVRDARPYHQIRVAWRHHQANVSMLKVYRAGDQMSNVFGCDLIKMC